MISKFAGTFENTAENAARFRIQDALAAYDGAVYSNGAGGFLSLTPGGACTAAGDFDAEELTAFLRFTGPASVLYEGEDISLSLEGYEKSPVTLLKYKGGPVAEDGDFVFDLSSDKVYAILKAANAFTLPAFEDFAVDFCRRRNHGGLICAARESCAAAIAFVCGGAALVNGVASIKKGYGGRALKSLISALCGRSVLAAAKNDAVPFYLKNNFTPTGGAVYYERINGETK